MKPISTLLTSLSGHRWVRAPEGDLRVGRIRVDSREVGPGDLFVATSGTSTDSHRFVPDVAARGAAAVVVEREVEGVALPQLVVPDARLALAELAAAWYDHPARDLPLVGITGTLGKTSIINMLAAVLERAGRRVGTIGSLGIRFDGRVEETGHTVPPPLILQRALAEMRDGGAELAMTEVTTHSMAQERVHGLRFALGIFANLVPMEHMEFHGTFADYAAVKTRYFDYVDPAAPMVYPVGDRAVRALVEERGLNGVGCGGSDDAMLYVERVAMTAEGSDLLLRVRDPLPRWDGGVVERCEFPLHVAMLGRANVNNAVLVATAALCLGVDPEPIRATLATFPSPRRRMEIVHRGRITVLDDTVGHPDSITATFEVAEGLTERCIHVVFAIRGQRGEPVNREAAEALAIWSARVPSATLVVTHAADTADERNRVAPEERDAFVGALEENGVRFRETERLDDAIGFALERAEEGDLLLLLGAQGMDAAAAMVRERIGG